MKIVHIFLKQCSKVLQLILRLKKNKWAMLTLLVLLASAIPFTVLIAKQQTNLQQHAMMIGTGDGGGGTTCSQAYLYQCNGYTHTSSGQNTQPFNGFSCYNAKAEFIDSSYCSPNQYCYAPAGKGTTGAGNYPCKPIQFKTCSCYNNGGGNGKNKFNCAGAIGFCSSNQYCWNSVAQHTNSWPCSTSKTDPYAPKPPTPTPTPPIPASATRCGANKAGYCVYRSDVGNGAQCSTNAHSISSSPGDCYPLGGVIAGLGTMFRSGADYMCCVPNSQPKTVTCTCDQNAGLSAARGGKSPYNQYTCTDGSKSACSTNDVCLSSATKPSTPCYPACHSNADCKAQPGGVCSPTFHKCFYTSAGGKSIEPTATPTPPNSGDQQTPDGQQNPGSQSTTTSHSTSSSPSSSSSSTSGSSSSTKNTVTLTPVPSGATKLNIALQLFGIGKNGNIHPRHTTREVHIQIYKATDDPTQPGVLPLVDQQTTVTFDSSSGYFLNPSIALTKTLPTASYQVLVKVPGYLRKQYIDQLTSSKTIALTTNQTNRLNVLTLIAGDVAPLFNIIDASDYYALVGCYKDKANTSTCAIGPQIADLNDDGTVDNIDLNYWLLGFQSIQTDESPQGKGDGITGN